MKILLIFSVLARLVIEINKTLASYQKNLILTTKSRNQEKLNEKKV